MFTRKKQMDEFLKVLCKELEWHLHALKYDGSSAGSSCC